MTVVKMCMTIERSGGPSVVNDDLLHAVEEKEQAIHNFVNFPFIFHEFHGRVSAKLCHTV